MIVPIPRPRTVVACALLFSAVAAVPARANEPSATGTSSGEPPRAGVEAAAPPTAAPSLVPAPPGNGTRVPAMMAKPRKITVFTAKKIVTMDPAHPTATAIAFSDGRILSVGSLADLEPWLVRYPHEIDRRFEKNVLVPGFVEAHGHPLLGGIFQTLPPLTSLPLPNPWGPAFPGVKNVAAAKAKLAAYAAEMKEPGAPLLTWGWDIAALGMMPDRTFLDSVSTDRPVFVWDGSGHNIFSNSAGLARYEITRETTKGVEGVGFRPDGTPSGQFLGAEATDFIVQRAGKDLLTPDQLPRAVLYSNDIAQQNGITTTSDMAFGVLDIFLETGVTQRMADAKATSLRYVVVAYWPAFKTKYGAEAMLRAADLRRFDSDRLFFRGIKFMSDDAFLADTMSMQNPGYVDGGGGQSFYASAEALAADMQPWWDAGWHIHVHSNGSGGNGRTLGALQILQDHKPRFDHRFTIQHYGISTSQDARKIKALGAAASVNPAYFYLHGDVQAMHLGTDRASYATRVGTLVREGVVTALHSDSPVASPMPLHEVWAVVTRRGLYSGDRRFAPAEAVSPEQALRMVTIDAAYTLGVEELVGSLEPGKFADFAVLGEDPLTVPRDRIKDVPVLATVLGGRVIPVAETKRMRALE